MAAEPLLIVLVDDDDGHAALVERNLKRIGVSNMILRLKDGQEALDFLNGETGRPPAIHPSRFCFCSTSRCPVSTGWRCSACSNPSRRPPSSRSSS